MQDPSYHELGPDKIPTAYPEGPDGPLKIKIISGQSHGVTSPVNPVGGCWYFHFIFKNKSTFFQDLREQFSILVITFRQFLTNCINSQRRVGPRSSMF